jgi:hypothetical protein
VTLQKAEAMAVVGDTLYFLVNAPVGTAVDQQGGLYACAVAAAAPCSPALVAASDHPSAIAVDQGRVLYSDWTGTNSYAPPLAPTALTGLGSSAFGLFVDGSAFFFTAMGIGVGNAVASVNQLTPSADTSVKLYESISAMATPGALVGAPDALYVTMYNAAAATPSVVRRMPRIATTTPCDYGGAGNQRPYGIHIDATRIYWTNLGGGPAPPNATDGSVVSCALAGCCTTPTVHWAGQGQPSGITGDDQALYFVTNKTGFVYRVAKP